jgi:hypothetical protein
MSKKHLEPLADSDEHMLEEMYDMLREYGATDEMFEYLADVVRTQVERHGPLMIGQGMGLDRNAVVTNRETGQPLPCELIVYHFDFAKASAPAEQVGRVVVGFMLKDGKIDQLVSMEGV